MCFGTLFKKNQVFECSVVISFSDCNWLISVANPEHVVTSVSFSIVLLSSSFSFFVVSDGNSEEKRIGGVVEIVSVVEVETVITRKWEQLAAEDEDEYDEPEEADEGR